MPVLQPPPPSNELRLDRYLPAHQITAETSCKVEPGELLKLNNSAFLSVKYARINRLVNEEHELERISRLAPDWDSYGAEPPAQESINSAKSILGLLAGVQVLPSSIVPSAGGGVSIYFVKGDRTAYVENYNNGSQALVMYDDQGFTEVLEIGNGSDLLPGEVSDRIVRFLE